MSSEGKLKLKRHKHHKNRNETDENENEYGAKSGAPSFQHSPTPQSAVKLDLSKRQHKKKKKRKTKAAPDQEIEVVGDNEEQNGHRKKASEFSNKKKKSGMGGNGSRTVVNPKKRRKKKNKTTPENEALHFPEKSKSIELTPELMNENFKNWTQRFVKRTLKEYYEEFNLNKKYLPTHSLYAWDHNPRKNRYSDVMCADDSRVILKDASNSNTYIHASWVSSMVPGCQQYIYAQGPLEETDKSDNTCYDFWHMVYQEKSQVIVMLCQLKEDNSSKCAPYWPAVDAETKVFAEYSIKNSGIELFEKNEDVLVTTLVLTNTKSNQQSTILHYQYTSWQDQHCPSHPGITIEILKTCKEKAGGRPVIVHCSAGIGRTGTFCGIDIVFDKVRHHPKMEFVDIFREMRNQRLHTIQTNGQYVFLAVCTVFLAVQKELVENDEHVSAFLKSFEKFYKKICKKKVVKDGKEGKEIEQ